MYQVLPLAGSNIRAERHQATPRLFLFAYQVTFSYEHDPLYGAGGDIDIDSNIVSAVALGDYRTVGILQHKQRQNETDKLWTSILQ